MTLSLDIIVPGTDDAVARGCTCPIDTASAGRLPVVFCCGGHFFDPWCPVHRNAVLADVQRMFGRPQ